MARLRAEDQLLDARDEYRDYRSKRTGTCWHSPARPARTHRPQLRRTTNSPACARKSKSGTSSSAAAAAPSPSPSSFSNDTPSSSSSSSSDGASRKRRLRKKAKSRRKSRRRRQAHVPASRHEAKARAICNKAADDYFDEIRTSHAKHKATTALARARRDVELRDRELKHPRGHRVLPHLSRKPVPLQRSRPPLPGSKPRSRRRGGTDAQGGVEFAAEARLPSGNARRPRSRTIAPVARNARAWVTGRRRARAETGGRAHLGLNRRSACATYLPSTCSRW